MDLYIDQQRKYRYTAYIHYSYIIIIIIPMSNYYYLPSARNRFETYNSPIILWFRTFRHNGHHIIFFIKIPIFIVVQDGPPREEYNILYDTGVVHYNTPTSRTDFGFLHTHTHTHSRDDRWVCRTFIRVPEQSEEDTETRARSIWDLCLVMIDFGWTTHS